MVEKQGNNYDNEIDISSAYDEKIWGKGIADGYVFRGKRLFGKAVEGLRKVMIKGSEGEINGINFKSLDTRKIGTEMTIDVKIDNGKQRGIALLKLYDTNNKKENVVMVSKSKKSDHEFVTILAEKVAKPLMEKLMLDKDVIDCKEEVEEKFECEVCRKVFSSQRGLKGHLTKMHGTKTKKATTNKRKTEEQISHAVKDTVKEVIEISDDYSTDEEVKEKSEKKYTNACDRCGFKTDTNRRYISLQQMKEHLCSNRNIKCKQCGKSIRSSQELKRHTRDQHGILSSSTSPPLKKKRKQTKLSSDNTDSEMEIDESEKDVKNISIQLEDMEIENNEEEAAILAERSRLMDEKVRAKQKRIEEEEKLQKEKLDVIEMNVEREKKEKKALRQKTKDLNKRNKKKQQQSHKKVTFAVSNINEIPDNCKKFVKENDVIYRVPGDGACGPNAAAAHLFKDEVFGPKLRKNMNIFFADHYYKKYHTISPCSPESPFIRNCQGRIIQFTDPELLIRFLKTSEDAKYMWSDGEDFVVIADMYQIHIKIITTKGPSDENPSVNWINPDEDLKEFAEIKDVEIEDMVIIHQNDIHFDLVVDKDSDLATLGSLSFRHNIGPTIKKSQENKKIENKDGETELEIMRKKLESCEKSKIALEIQYKECEADLRKMTEEVEKLKIKNNDLIEMIQLEKEVREKHIEIDFSDEESEGEIVSEIKTEEKDPKSTTFKYRPNGMSREKEFNCEECDYQGTRQNELQKHIQLKHDYKNLIKCSVCGENFVTDLNFRSHIMSKHTEEENSCNEYENQAATEDNIQKHTDLTHVIINKIYCRICGEQFLTKGGLMHHRKKEHPAAVAYCSNKLNGQCSRSDDMCWWSHVVKTGESKTCYICGKDFKNKNEMMIHRKKEHASIVKDCEEFIKNQCRYQEDFCWYKHATKETDDEIMEIESNQVFQKVSENLKPPIVLPQKRTFQ